MEIDSTATTEVTGVAVSLAGDVAAHADAFGTRPQTGRPHSMSLFGSDPGRSREGGSRSLDVLIGVGIGAAVMYYLDPDGGPRRRALVRDKIVDAVMMAPDAFEDTAHDVGRWARRTLEQQVDRLRQPPRDARVVHWTPGGRLVASAVGGALTLLAAKRHDALGAAVGLVGSALLARGVSGSAPRRTSESEGSTQPLPREVGDALERPGLLEEV
jgi:hypothetical protein